MSSVALRVGGSVVAEYLIHPDIDATLVPRPYLHPVRTLGGTVVTDALPADHRWHLGVGLAMPDVAGANLWGGRSYVHGQGYVWLPDHGRIQHTAWRGQSAEQVTHDLAWTAPNGDVLLMERRTVRAEANGPKWTLTMATNLTNPGGSPIELRSPAVNGRGDGAGYGGFFWRLPSTADPTLTAGSSRAEQEANGSAWPELTVSGTAASGRYTLTFRGLRDNDRWFVRLADYPAVGAALAFRRPLVIMPGRSVERTYRVEIGDA